MRENENVLSLLQNKSSALALASDAITAVTNDWQMIQQYLSNRLAIETLTDIQQLKLKRYNFIYSHLLEGKYSKHQILTMTMKVFDIQQTQAYEDYNCTTEVFASVVHINKLFELQLMLERAKDMERKAIAMQDYKAAAQFQKNQVKIIEVMPEKEEIPGEFFEGHIIEATDDPRLVGGYEVVDKWEVLRLLNEKRKVPLDITFIQNIPHEDIPDAS